MAENLVFSVPIWSRGHGWRIYLPLWPQATKSPVPPGSGSSCWQVSSCRSRSNTDTIMDTRQRGQVQWRCMCEVYCPHMLAEASSNRLKPSSTCVRCTSPTCWLRPRPTGWNHQVHVWGVLPPLNKYMCDVYYPHMYGWSLIQQAENCKYVCEAYWPHILVYRCWYWQRLGVQIHVLTKARCADLDLYRQRPGVQIHHWKKKSKCADVDTDLDQQRPGVQIYHWKKKNKCADVDTDKGQVYRCRYRQRPGVQIQYQKRPGVQMYVQTKAMYTNAGVGKGWVWWCMYRQRPCTKMLVWAKAGCADECTDQL